METIFERRSIRKYSDEIVPDESIEKIIKAGMAAPSAGNSQPWHFVVIKDKSLLNEIPKFHPYSRMLYDVNCAIVVCGDPSVEKHKGFWVQDCSAATQNMLLMAHAMGLGSVWIGVYPAGDRVEAVKELLGLPEHIIPLSIMPVGYPAEKKGPIDRFHKSKIHINRW